MFHTPAHKYVGPAAPAQVPVSEEPHPVYTTPPVIRTGLTGPWTREEDDAVRAEFAKTAGLADVRGLAARLNRTRWGVESRAAYLRRNPSV